MSQNKFPIDNTQLGKKHASLSEHAQVICAVNQLTGFYMRATLVIIGLIYTQSLPKN